ncbi:uncharacterized protein BT62DRAFT_1050482 [Guyanagaster necrorhizus]|uniref:Uncharacterized protein n=1 Tax=Guyanagaster necrorhizus TaxID=856835 RepID=A0A9P8AXM2_9AGAR|nr:uncharacterized protein BT62DRAFT_1050482 [Guyanagaster necrorhizus MCA 3950]KAG7450082.1 hypothetical protein BT62DRAFT_1050482 [Guyanagaster necrorhizus MCA 3950]
MLHYPLCSHRNTTVVPATPGMDSPLSQLSDSSTTSTQGATPVLAVSHVPASGATVLRNLPLAHAQAEEEDSNHSEKSEDVGFKENLITEVSDNDSSCSDVDNGNDYESSTSSIFEKASHITDAEESNRTARPARLRHTQSLDDLGKHEVHFGGLHKGRKLMKEQLSTIDAAEQNLTTAQQEMLAKRQNKLMEDKGREQPTASQTPMATSGPSSYIAKEKFVDHNQEIDNTELDTQDINQKVSEGDVSHSEAHPEVEDGFMTVRKSSKHNKQKGPQGLKPKTKVHKTDCYDALEVEETSDEDSESDLEAEPQPKKAPSKTSAKSSKRKTLPPDSFLADVLDVGKSKKKRKVSPERKKKLNKKKLEKQKHKHHASSSSSESSESTPSNKSDSDSDSNYSESSPSDDSSSSTGLSSSSSSSSDASNELDASDSFEPSNYRHQHHHHYTRRHADGEKFHCFTMELTQFCKEGQVPKDEWVFLASHYLKGKALSFFIQKVLKNHAEWTLIDFL